MSAQFTEALLHIDPVEAIVAMVNEVNNTNFRGSEVVVSPPRALGPTLTEVTITNRKSFTDADFDVTLPDASIVFQYHRIELENRYPGSLAGFRPAMPTSTQVLVNELASRTGHVFGLEDFVQRDITGHDLVGSNFSLTAKVESWRFVGSTPVLIGDLQPIDQLQVDPAPIYDNTYPQLRSVASALPYLDASEFSVELEQVDTSGTAMFTVVETAWKALAYSFDDQLNFLPPEARAPYSLVVDNNIFSNAVSSATMVREERSDWHPTNPMLNRTMTLQIPSQGSKSFVPLDDLTIVLPYYRHVEKDHVFDVDGRMQVNGSINSYDGTIYRAWFMARQLNEVITPDDVPNFSGSLSLIDTLGLEDWRISYVTGPYNLNQSVVTYHGRRQRYHPASTADVDNTLNRVIVFALNPDYNSNLLGNLIVPYRAVVICPDRFDASGVGLPYEAVINLPVLNDHDSPSYTLTMTSGGLAPGHSLESIGSGVYRITGTAMQVGVYDFELTATSTLGSQVYDCQYQVSIERLNVFGDMPAGLTDTAISYDYFAQGGLGPYTYEVVGNFPFDLDVNSGHVSGQVTVPGLYTWTIIAEDSLGSRAYLEDSAAFGDGG